MEKQFKATNRNQLIKQEERDKCHRVEAFSTVFE